MIFRNIYVLPWHCIILLMPMMMLLVCALCALFRLIKIRGTISCMGMTLIWGSIVVINTVVGRSEAVCQVDIRPLGSYIRALEQPELYRANFMNVLLFFPGGMLLALAMQGIKALQKKWKLFWVVTLILCVMSLSIELLQYWFSLGMAETDDVLHNTLGAMLGCGAGHIAKKFIFR